MTLAIPNEQTITVEWFNQCFERCGIDATVSGFDAERVGTGQIGKCIRYTLRYESAAKDVPTSLVGKFPSDDESSRATGVALQNFLKEVRFYQQLQSRLSSRTPRCYFAEITGEGPEFFLLLEDLAPALQGDQLKGCNAEAAEAALTQLVGLHGPSWCDSSLAQLPWLYDTTSRPPTATLDLYRAQLPGFVDRYGPALADDECRIIQQLGEVDHSPLVANGVPEVFSLIHVDYRLDNLLFHTKTGTTEVTAVDWQSITLGSPLSDVAYFIGAGLLPADRAPVEERLVRSYYDALCASGVDGYVWPDCWQAYRYGAFAGFAVTVVASMIVERTARGDQMFTTMAQRHARHALDLGADEFLRA
ncbi:MAG: phosphotransferase [Pseudomonadota bacterium]|nr:phosphotransferase [Pseudomonadota bacterium]